MARVYNWQIGREMSYWYPESRPKRQFAAVFDTNKCIACQTCTLACKTTWTSRQGPGVHAVEQRRDEALRLLSAGWDVKLLEKLGAQKWDGQRYAGRTIFEAAPAGERVLGWRPEDIDYAYPNVGEDDCAGQRGQRRPLQLLHNSLVLLPGAHLQPLHLPGLPRLLPARLDLQAAGGRHRAGRPGALPRLSGVRQGLSRTRRSSTTR